MGQLRVRKGELKVFLTRIKGHLYEHDRVFIVLILRKTGMKDLGMDIWSNFVLLPLLNPKGSYLSYWACIKNHNSLQSMGIMFINL